MRAPSLDGRAQRSVSAMARDRAELLSLLSAETADPNIVGVERFPRSQTMRWITGNLSASSVVATVAGLLLSKSPLAVLFKIR